MSSSEASKPWVTVVFCSHNKPVQCREMINSMINQTFPNWACVIHDSGVLYDQGYFNEDPRITVLRSDETDEMRTKYNMASYLFNRTDFKTEWAMFLCDDDLLYSRSLETFHNYSQQGDVKAMYGHGYFTGPYQPFPYSYARTLRGKCVNGARLDCLVDGGQVCVKTELLKRHKWSESKQDQWHADGVWMESIGEETPFEPVDVFVLHNRNIPGVSLGVKYI